MSEANHIAIGWYGIQVHVRIIENTVQQILSIYKAHKTMSAKVQRVQDQNTNLACASYDD